MLMLMLHPFLNTFDFPPQSWMTAIIFDNVCRGLHLTIRWNIWEKKWFVLKWFTESSILKFYYLPGLCSFLYLKTNLNTVKNFHVSLPVIAQNWLQLILDWMSTTHKIPNKLRWNLSFNITVWNTILLELATKKRNISKPE